MQVDQNGVKVTIKDIEVQPTAPKYLAKQVQEIIIPSYASWFSFSEIHDIEKKALPEFFNNKNKSKTPQVYKDYRDFMINTYRLNPSEYLTVTACRRNLAGDVCAIIRVHAVLEQPSSVGPPFTGHFRVTADTPRGLQPLFPAISVKENVPIDKTEPKLKQAPLSVSKNVYEDVKDPEPVVKQKFKCHTCGVDCTAVRYHCTKKPDEDICQVCYKDGRFSSALYSGDFIKLNDGEKQEKGWSEQETLLLLEGLELYKEDWTKISQHVGTRTREECLLHFLKLPIEDTFIGHAQEKLGPLQFQKVPFSVADNPVLSLASFLASVVDPKVASAAAEAAVSQVKGKPLSPTKKGELEKAGAAAFGSAAGKAQTLADLEEKEMQKLTRVLIETQLQKLELKLQHFQELEAFVEHEKLELEKERQKLYQERLLLKKSGLASPSRGPVPVKDAQMDVDDVKNFFKLQ
ncbi:SWIRM domain-containing protein [Gorgonomyces haynaldii]|nr:SWIRM domain-containing protein [Gorgonomyces haynaldii]